MSYNYAMTDLHRTRTFSDHKTGLNYGPKNNEMKWRWTLCAKTW